MTNNCVIAFVEPSHTTPGTTIELMNASYAAYRQKHTALVDSWRPRWKAFDDLVYADTRKSRQFCFFTTYKSAVIGFCSWDPRGRPLARIGDNCILPEFRGRSLGKRQMIHALRTLGASRFSSAVVQTGTDDFFRPARTMYEACGFVFQRKVDTDAVEYAIDIRPARLDEASPAG